MAFFGVEDRGTADVAEPEYESSPLIAGADVFGGDSEDFVGGGEVRSVAKTPPVLRWQARQWQTPTPCGSPLTSMRNWPQEQEAAREGIEYLVGWSS